MARAAEARTMGRGDRALALGAALLTLSLAVGVSGLQALDGVVLWALPWLAFAAVGALTVALLPRHGAAWALLLMGAVSSVWSGLSWVLRTITPENLAVWNLAHVVTTLTMIAVLVLIAATFPSGSFETAADRRTVACFAALVPLLPLLHVLATGEQLVAFAFDWGGQVRSFPVGLQLAALSSLALVTSTVFAAILVLGPLAGAVLLTLRYLRHRRESDARRRLRWPAYGAVALGLIPLKELAHRAGLIPTTASEVTEAVLLMVLPLSFGVALLRPDIFDPNAAARRTLLYLPLWIVVALTYIGAAAVLGFRAGGDSVRLAVAVALVATVVFEPLRRHVVQRLHRRIFGPSVSSAELVRRMGETFAHTLDQDALARSIAETARDGLRAHWVRLEQPGRPDAVAAADPGDRSPTGDAGAGALRVDLSHAGTRLGRLVCGPPRDGVRRPEDHDLLETLGTQASLALANARLADDLTRSLAEVEAKAEDLVESRARLVTAEECARRRIERDLHDGTQQEIVALLARIALARTQVETDPARAARTLETLRDDAAAALVGLRDLTAGIHPAVLEDRGLVEALEVRAARLSVPVDVEVEPCVRRARWAPAAESALYFLANEALTNVVKHARADQVRLHLGLEQEATAVLVVADDGVGFTPEGRAHSGIAGMRDRLAALGGCLAVHSGPGAGTRVVARLPVVETTGERDA